MSPRAAPMSPEDRRVAIIDAVVPLLVEHGPQVSTRQIAQAAGIAEGTIFRVFDDKPALWCAVAEHVLDPRLELAELDDALGDADDLRTLVELAVAHLHARSSRVMAVMMALRGVWASRPEAAAGPAARGGPPPFLAEANRALLDGLTLLLAPHADELTVTPATAARVLRALVLGGRHPGADVEHHLDPAEIAEVLLHGIAHPTPPPDAPHEKKA